MNRSLASSTLPSFTLIECVVYVALLSICVQGIVLAFYGFTQTIARAQTEAALHDEGSFILSKIAYESYRSSDVIVSTSSASATFTNDDGSVTTIRSEGTDIVLSHSIDSFEPLVSRKDNVSDLHFSSTPLLGTGKTLRITFTLTSRSESGHTETESFDDSWQIPL